MADAKISALTALTGADVAVGDLLPIVDVSATASKSITTAELVAYLQTKGMPRVARLASDHAISSVTGTEVTCGLTGLLAGTYVFRWDIIAQSATTSVSPMWGVNFTGTAAVRKLKIRITSTGTTAITGVADDAGGSSGQIEESCTSSTFATATGNLGFTGGVATINVDIYYIIEGIMIVTATGDLELWHGSETATSTTTKAGTSLLCWQTA